MLGGHQLLRRAVAGGPRGKLRRGVRALYAGAPTVADLEQAGLSLESDEIRTENPDGWFYDGTQWKCVLWAENWPAMRFFLQIKTQWLHGFSGPTGLNYLVVFHELDRRNLTQDEYDDLFGSLRLIESTALEEMRKV